jgi:hypothetical protein
VSPAIDSITDDKRWLAPRSFVMFSEASFHCLSQQRVSCSVAATS